MPYGMKPIFWFLPLLAAFGIGVLLFTPNKPRRYIYGALIWLLWATFYVLVLDPLHTYTPVTPPVRIGEGFSIGLVVLGFALAIRSWKADDVIVYVAWALSLSFMIAWLVSTVIVALTLGFGMTPQLQGAILSQAALAGVFCGLSAYRSRRSVVPHTGSTALGFALGTICAFLLGYGGGRISITMFRALWLSHGRQMRVATGLAILAAGWAVGAWIIAFFDRRSRTQFGLAASLIGGTAIIAVFLFVLDG
jgi:hypothetical protein